MRFAPVLIAVAVATASPASPAWSRAPRPAPGNEFYRSTDGQMVHRPTQGANPAYGRVTAICRDGTSSYSHHRRGTCTGHSGVREWQ